MKEKIFNVINFELDNYNNGFISSYNMIDFIADEIDDTNVLLRLIDKRDELLKELNEFTSDLINELLSGKDISEIV